MVKNQGRIKGTIDQRAMPRSFVEGDIVLLLDKTNEKPGMHKNFDNLWLSPYQIENKVAINFSYLISLNSELSLQIHQFHE